MYTHTAKETNPLSADRVGLPALLLGLMANQSQQTHTQAHATAAVAQDLHGHGSMAHVYDHKYGKLAKNNKVTAEDESEEGSD